MGDNHSSNGEDREQMPKVESKKNEDDAEVEGQVCNELTKEDDMVEGGSEKMLESYCDKDEQGSWKNVSVVQESDTNMGMSEFGSAGGVRINEPVVNSMQIQNEGNQRVKDEVVTPGFVRSVTRSEINSPGLNI